MNGEIKFRTGLGGYNKDDVNKYIKDTDIKFSTQIDDILKYTSNNFLNCK